MPDFSKARKNMVDCQIHPNGVVSEPLLEAFRTLPREKFIPDHLHGIAYHDQEINLGKGRCLPAPALQARLMQAAELQTTDRVLVIGATNGYAALIIASIAAQVYALEEKPEFTDKTSALATFLGIKNLAAVTGPLPPGHEAGAPYDLIFFDGAVSATPDKIAKQLKPGGRMVGVFKDKNAHMGQAVLWHMAHNGQVSSLSLFETAAQTLPGFEAKTTFSFA